MSQEAAELLERSPPDPPCSCPDAGVSTCSAGRSEGGRAEIEGEEPREASESITGYCVSVKLSDRDPLCQRLAAVAAFCDFWLSGVDWAWDGWIRLHMSLSMVAYEKPTRCGAAADPCGPH